jgi:hypothetical protein
MEIPDNWQEELMLREWKMMRIERCKEAYVSGPWYHFPNGIRFQYNKIDVDVERAPAVMAALSDCEPKKHMEKGSVRIELHSDQIRKMTVGESEDFMWRIYSLDI